MPGRALAFRMCARLEQEMRNRGRSTSPIKPAYRPHVEQDPLLIILWRLNHQGPHAADAIKGDSPCGRRDAERPPHVHREDIIGRIHRRNGQHVERLEAGRQSLMTWLVGIIAAIGAAWATAKKSLL